MKIYKLRNKYKAMRTESQFRECKIQLKDQNRLPLKRKKPNGEVNVNHSKRLCKFQRKFKKSNKTLTFLQMNKKDRLKNFQTKFRLKMIRT